MDVPGLRMASFDVAAPLHGEDGARWEANDGFVLHGYRAAGHGWVTIPGFAAYRFDREGEVLAENEGVSEQAILDAWYRSVLPLVLQARGTQVLHASAVACERGVVALCGTSTSGKSTLAWALEGRGYPVLADDALPFTVDLAATVYPIPHRLRLRPDVLEFHEIVPEEGVRAPDPGPQPLVALITLERGKAESGAQPLAPAAAFAALLPHAYCFGLDVLEEKAALADAYMELATRVPASHLILPEGLDRLGEAVDAVELLIHGE